MTGGIRAPLCYRYSVILSSELLPIAPYFIRIVEWLEFDSRSHQPNRHHSGVSHLYKSAQADLQFCSPGLNNVTRGTEKVSWKQSGLSLQHLVGRALVYFKVPSTNTPARDRRRKNAMKRSGQLADGKEFQINVFKIQSGIRNTNTFGFTACRVTGVTLHGLFCCARLNTPPPPPSLSDRCFYLTV
jgi:hypothetical protein